MSSDMHLPARTLKILDDFVERHSTHLDKGCQTFQKTCPFCQLIVEEQTDKTYDIVHALFSTRVARALIDNPEMADHRPDELIGNLAFVAYQDWVQPRYDDIELTDEELLEHPYVRRKIQE
jgi:hypothetical protein